MVINIYRNNNYQFADRICSYACPTRTVRCPQVLRIFVVHVGQWIALGTQMCCVGRRHIQNTIHLFQFWYTIQNATSKQSFKTLCSRPSLSAAILSFEDYNVWAGKQFSGWCNNLAWWRNNLARRKLVTRACDPQFDWLAIIWLIPNIFRRKYLFKTKQSDLYSPKMTEYVSSSTVITCILRSHKVVIQTQKK